jgi:hypothetical protein
LSCNGKKKAEHLDVKADWEHGDYSINDKGGEKKRKERDEKEREEEHCAENQKSAWNCGYYCHQHAKKVAKIEQHEESKKRQ